MTDDPLLFAFALLVGVVSVARTARLLIYDEFPPVEWLRLRFFTAVGPESPWAKLAKCPYCLAPYLSAGMLAWGWLSWGHEPAMTIWWAINGIWAGAYAAAILVSYDEAPE